MREADFWRIVLGELLEVPAAVRHVWSDDDLMIWWLKLQTRPEFAHVQARLVPFATVRHYCAALLGKYAA